MATTGAGLGVFCALTARHYERLLDAGFAADGDTLASAICAARIAPLVPIIWVDGSGRADRLQLAAALAGGVVLAGVYARYGDDAVFVCRVAAVLMLLMLACIDARICLLPDALTQPLLWLGLVMAWQDAGPGLQPAMAGVITGYGLLAVPRWLWLCLRKQDAVGAGDVKLLAALGPWVGAWGVAHVLMLSCVAGALFTALHQRRWRPSGAYPFGPFIALAAVADFLSPSGLQSLFYV